MCLFPVVTVSLYSPMTHNVCFDDCFFKQLEGEQNPFSKRFKQCMAPTFAASSGGFWSRQILSAFIGSKVVSINQVDLVEILSHWHVQYMSLIPVYMSSVYLACSLPAFDLCATCKRPLLIWAVPPWKWRGAHWDGHAVWLPPGPAIYIYTMSENMWNFKRSMCTNMLLSIWDIVLPSGLSFWNVWTFRNRYQTGFLPISPTTVINPFIYIYIHLTCISLQSTAPNQHIPSTSQDIIYFLGVHRWCKYIPISFLVDQPIHRKVHLFYIQYPVYIYNLR